MTNYLTDWTNLTYLGVCLVTAYLPHKPGSDRHWPRAGVTCAASRSLPLGTVLLIEGIGRRVVTDRPEAAYDSRVDLPFETDYRDAMAWGVKRRRVWVVGCGERRWRRSTVATKKGLLCMTNAFAYRDTDPRGMKAHPSPVGDDNHHHILDVGGNAALVVAAWGKDGRHMNQDLNVCNWLASIDVKIHCLGKNGDRTPRHPLYLKATTLPEIYQP